MDLRTKICIWIILIGLVNFLAYTIGYMFIEGEAIHGYIEHQEGTGQVRYVLQSGQEVSRGIYIYSGIHSISVWITVAAVMLAMLTLAKERITSSLRAAIIRGRTLITILATIITLATIIITIWFSLQFAKGLMHPRQVKPSATSAAIEK